MPPRTNHHTERPPTSSGRSAWAPDDAPYPLVLECLGSGPGEADERGLDRGGPSIWRREPEHGIGTRERLLDDGGIAVRAFDDLDAITRFGRESRQVAHDDAQGLPGVEQEQLETVVERAAIRTVRSPTAPETQSRRRRARGERHGLRAVHIVAAGGSKPRLALTRS
jgi:hypothetical protein